MSEIHRRQGGCRSSSWTQKSGYQCPGCSDQTFDKIPVQRVHLARFRSRHQRETLPSSDLAGLGELALQDEDGKGSR